MDASDKVFVLQVGGFVTFRFDYKILEFRNAFITLTSDGLFIKFIAKSKRHIAHKLSNYSIMTKDELAYAMGSIMSMYQLEDCNKEDVDKILKALNGSMHKRSVVKMNSKDDIYRLIEAADKCRKEIVLCLLGKPGIGKTEAVERFAKDHGRKVVHIIASQILPSEVSGMTMPNQETKSMDIFDHYRLSHMKDGDILFFDELLKGQQQVLNACLTLIQERRLMSGTKLPDVLVIAAANPLATPLQLPLEIRQRFMFVEVEWGQHQWVDYMKALGFEDNQFLWDLSDKVKSMLDRDDAWNTLTPRSATKLCLWLRDSKNDQSVRDFIMKSFGSEVLKFINDAVFGCEIKSAEVQTAAKVIEILQPKHVHPDNADEFEKIDEAIQAAAKITEGKETDLTELLSKLQTLPEWGDIQEALSQSKIETDKIEF